MEQIHSSGTTYFAQHQQQILRITSIYGRTYVSFNWFVVVQPGTGMQKEFLFIHALPLTDRLLRAKGQHTLLW